MEIKEPVTALVVTILGVGMSLAALIFVTTDRLHDRIDRLETRMVALEKDVSQVKGLLRGIGVAGNMPTDKEEEDNT